MYTELTTMPQRALNPNLPQQGQLPSACCYPASGRVVSSGQLTDPATVQRKEASKRHLKIFCGIPRPHITLYLYVVLFENGHTSVRVWVGELGQHTIGSEPLIQQDAVGLNVMLFVIMIGYCMTTMIQFCFQPRCKVLVALEDCSSQFVHQLVKTQVHLKEDLGGNRLQCTYEYLSSNVKIYIMQQFKMAHCLLLQLQSHRI